MVRNELGNDFLFRLGKSSLTWTSTTVKYILFCYAPRWHTGCPTRVALARGFFGLGQPIRAGSAGKRTAPCSPLTFNTNEVSSSSFPASLPRWRRGYQAVQPAGAEAVHP